jgi:uncharacterized protein (DUF2249 family)
MTPIIQLDLRTLPPHQRHEKIFTTFQTLHSGETLQIINDHDPKPLYYQFLHDYPHRFQWTYDQSGPREWKISIVKIQANSDASMPDLPSLDHSPSVTSDDLSEPSEVLLDVRPLIQAHQEPRAVILQAVRNLQPHQSLHLINTFEPLPLYSLLQKMGLDHTSKNLEGTWHIYFKKNPNHLAQSHVDTPDSTLPVSISVETLLLKTPKLELDVQHLSPPEPMIRILEVLPEIGSTGVLVVHHHREPVLLYDALKEQHYHFKTIPLGSRGYQIFIWKMDD